MGGKSTNLAEVLIKFSLFNTSQATSLYSLVLCYLSGTAGEFHSLKVITDLFFIVRECVKLYYIVTGCDVLLERILESTSQMVNSDLFNRHEARVQNKVR